ncbi:MAG: nuclear transport factor 2 family protein [Gemmatimonadaceae bacterium]
MQRRWAVLFLAVNACTGPRVNATTDGQEVERIVRERIAAARAGDVATWHRHISDSAQWIGPGLAVVTTKSAQDEISSNRSLPSAASTIHDMQVRVNGNWALATYYVIDSVTNAGPVLGKRFRKADTYLRENGSWVLHAAVEIAVPRRPIVQLTEAAFAGLIGTYAIDANVQLKVWVTDGKLHFGTGADDQQELWAQDSTTFFTDGDPGDWIFESVGGRASALIFRMTGSPDIRLKRID